MTAIDNTNTIHNVHPWRRSSARSFDMAVMVILFGLILVIFFPSIGKMPLTLQSSMEDIIAGAITMLLSPFFISLFGTTPGKFLFGLKVRDKNSEKLSILTAFKREFLVYMNGMAFCIPLLNIIMSICSYSRLKKRGNTSWDEKLNCSIIYQKNKLIQKILIIIGFILCIILLVFISNQNRNNPDIKAFNPSSFKLLLTSI